jgi:hypothetical protein
LSLDFHTSPYSKKEKTSYVKQNAMAFKMGCETLSAFNGTHNNTVVHFSFNEKNNYAYEAVNFDEKYHKTNITVNRTDTNYQYFNLTMDEPVNFLQVQSHMLYKFVEDGNPGSLSIKDGTGLEDFIANAHTSSIFKTTEMVVYDQIVEAAELNADP